MNLEIIFTKLNSVYSCSLQCYFCIVGVCANLDLVMTTYDGNTTPRITITSQTGENVPQIQDGEMWILPEGTNSIAFTVTSSQLVVLDKLAIHINGYVELFELQYLNSDGATIAEVGDLDFAIYINCLNK